MGLADPLRPQAASPLGQAPALSSRLFLRRPGRSRQLRPGFNVGVAMSNLSEDPRKIADLNGWDLVLPGPGDLFIDLAKDPQAASESR